MSRDGLSRTPFARRKLRERLKKLIEQEITSADNLISKTGEGASNHQSTLDLDSHVRLIQSYSSLLAVTSPSRVPQKTKFLIISVVLIGLLMTALWLSKRAETRISLVIRATAIRAQVSRRWDYKQPFEASKAAKDTEAKFTNVSEITADVLGDPAVARDRQLHQSSLTVASDRLHLTSLTIGENSELELVLRDRYVDLSWWGKVGGTLQFTGAAVLSGSDPGAAPQRFTLTAARSPGIISFGSDGTGLKPAELTISREELTHLVGLRMSELHLSQMTALYPGEDSFESTVKGGTLTLREFNQNSEIHDGDRVILKGLQSDWTSITAADALELRLQGSVKEIRIGPEGSEENLTPSWLEYIYYRKPLVLMWGLLLFVLGELWNFIKS
jgi:hypothetical protein